MLRKFGYQKFLGIPLKQLKVFQFVNANIIQKWFCNVQRELNNSEESNQNLNNISKYNRSIRRFNYTKTDKDELLVKLENANTLKDINECLNSLLMLSIFSSDFINHKSFLEFLNQLKTNLKDSEVDLHFLKKLTSFLNKYNLFGSIDMSILCEKISARKDDFLKFQQDIRTIMNKLINVRGNAHIVEFFSLFEKHLTNSLSELDDSTMIDLLYCSHSYSPFIYKNKFLKKIKEDFELRIPKYDLETSLYSLKLFKLPYNQNELLQKILSLLEKCIIEKLELISTKDIMNVIDCLEDYKLSPSFCEKFERYVIENLPKFEKNEIIKIINFMTLDGFDTPNEMIYQLELEIPHRNLKILNTAILMDMQESGNNKINNPLTSTLFKYAATRIERNNISMEDKALFNIEHPLIVQKLSNHENVAIEMIKSIDNPYELKRVCSACSLLDIDNPIILDFVRTRLCDLLRVHDFGLPLLANIISSISSLRYLIDLEKYKILFDHLLDKIQNQINQATPNACIDLIKIICWYQFYDRKKELYRSLLKDVANYIIKKEYIFNANDTLEILKYLSLSPLTCNKSLVEYMLSGFNPIKNERYSIESKDFDFKTFYVSLYQIKKYDGKISYDFPCISQLYQKGREEFINYNLKPRPKRGLNYLLKANVAKNFGEVVNKYPHLLIEQQQITDCYEFDFSITDMSNVKNKKVLYIDVFDETSNLINKPEAYEPFVLAKSHYMRIFGYNYLIITSREWKSVVKSKYVDNVLKNAFNIDTLRF